jgi:AcrR family transcriptional regulator
MRTSEERASKLVPRKVSCGDVRAHARPLVSPSAAWHMVCRDVISTDMEEARAYETLRAEQVDRTRERILRCAGEELAEVGGESFSLLGVARRARISPRTIYRYFPTREVLVTAFGEWLTEQVGFDAEHAGIVDLCEQVFRGFARHESAIRAARWSKLVSDANAGGRQRRIRTIERLVAEAAVGADEAEVRRAAAAIHVLFGSAAWVALRDEHGLEPEEALEVSRSALLAILRELQERTRRARRRDRR